MKEVNSYIKNRKQSHIPEKHRLCPLITVPQQIKDMLKSDDMEMVELGVTICQTKYRISNIEILEKFISKKFIISLDKETIKVTRVEERITYGLWQQLYSYNKSTYTTSISTGKGGLKLIEEAISQYYGKTSTTTKQ